MVLNHPRGWKYYYSSTKVNGKLLQLHQEIWKSINGKIPDGYIIHHKDWDSLNNDISNLQCVTKAEHNRIHSCGSERWNNRRNNPQKGKCIICGKEFTTLQGSLKKYCSRHCGHIAMKTGIAKRRKNEN